MVCWIAIILEDTRDVITKGRNIPFRTLDVPVIKCQLYVLVQVIASAFIINFSKLTKNVLHSLM